MVGGTDNGRRKTRNHGYDVIVGGELFTDYSDHPRKLVTLNPKLKSTGAGRYHFFPTGIYRKQLGLKRLLSEKSGRCGIAAEIKERGALPMIDRGGDIRQANRPLQQYLGFTAGRCCGQFEHKADSLIAKFKEAGENGQRD